MAILGPLARLALAICVLGLGLSPAFAVFGGKPLGNSDPLAKTLAAVLNLNAGGAQLCTAVVLAPKLLLTAAHCVTGDRRQIKILFATELADIGSDRIRTVAAVARPDRTSASKGTYAYNNPDDISLILLDTSAPKGVISSHMSASVPPDSSIRVAGYGATSDLRKANEFGQRQLGFDKQLRVATMPLTSTGAALLTADQTHGAGVCTGDSGSPALLAGDAGLALVGLLVGVSSARTNNDYCRGKAYFASIARWITWIEASAEALGQPLP